MELRHLRYFVAVAEELHFRRAAERLHISQPPLSQQIRALERELGVVLLRRDRRKVELTEAGRAFLEDARDVLAGAARAAEHVRRVDAGQIGHVAVGFVGSSLYGRVPEILRTFREERPEVELRLAELSTNAQIDRLHRRVIDVGFLRPPVDGAGDIVIETIEREPLVLALPADHPLARSDARVDPSRLADEPWVTLSAQESPSSFSALTRLLGRSGETPRVVQAVTELPTAVALVATGIGIALVPESVTSLSRADVAYRELSGAPTTVELAVVHRDEPSSPAVAAFLEVVRRS